MGGTKDLTGKCEAYASELLVSTGRAVKPSQFCTLLNEGGKHALVIDIFSTDGVPCIRERSVMHGVGFMDPARRPALAWGKLLSDCSGRGSKGLPSKYGLDKYSENRSFKLDQEIQRQLDNIYKTKGAKRTRNNNNNVNTKKPNVKRRPGVSRGLAPINPPLTTAATSYARAMNAINRKSVGDKRTRNNNNNNTKTVKRVKPALNSREMNLAQLRKDAKEQYDKIQNITEQLRRKEKNPDKWPYTIRRLKKERLGLLISRTKLLIQYYRRTGNSDEMWKQRKKLEKFKKLMPK